MFVLPLLFQLSAATIPPALSPKDSAALLERVREARFWFVMDQRYQIVLDGVAPRIPGMVTHVILPNAPPPPRGGTVSGSAVGARGRALARGNVPLLKVPEGDCKPVYTIDREIDQHHAMAHMVRKHGDVKNTVCATMSRQAPTAESPGDVDRWMSIEARDTIRAHRSALLRKLDSAVRALPGDRWLAGQRVLLLIDHDDIQAAYQATRNCAAPRWWCFALQGYVLNVVGDRVGVVGAITNAVAAMPAEVRRQWEDVEYLFTYTGRAAYGELAPDARDSVNRVAWWLADPLFIEDGNDRLADHLFRRIRAELNDGEVGLWSDWRANYYGPVFSEAVVRYGWPFRFPRCSNRTDGISRGNASKPIPFRRGDTRSWFLGCPERTERDLAQLFGGDGLPPLSLYFPGPQFHTMPNWRAIEDPFHVTDADWDLAPERDVGTYWDGSWWAPEFYVRAAGALVAVERQSGVLRRYRAPLLVAAMLWDTARYTFSTPTKVIAAVVAMTGPDSPRLGLRDTMSTKALHGLAATIPNEPSVVSLEMVPANGVGTAGRSRFGITPPPPLSLLTRGDIAISDPILARAARGDDPPANVAALLPRMYGSARLVDPSLFAVYWELYGTADGDTIDVAVKVQRKDGAGVIERFGEVIGVNAVKRDSIVVRWREPRRGDATGSVDGGISIRPRGIVLDVSQLPAGPYAIAVRVQRGAASATSSRDLTIVRKR